MMNPEKRQVIGHNVSVISEEEPELISLKSDHTTSSGRFDQFSESSYSVIDSDRSSIASSQF